MTGLAGWKQPRRMTRMRRCLLGSNASSLADISNPPQASRYTGGIIMVRVPVLRSTGNSLINVSLLYSSTSIESYYFFQDLFSTTIETGSSRTSLPQTPGLFVPPTPPLEGPGPNADPAIHIFFCEKSYLRHPQHWIEWKHMPFFWNDVTMYDMKRTNWIAERRRKERRQVNSFILKRYDG